MRNIITEFFIPGEPVGKGRPRVTTRGAFTPKKTRDYENLVRKIYSRRNSFSGPVGMEIRAYFPIPKSYTKAKRKRILEQDMLYTKKPDADNIAKIICDALNGEAYEDDSYIVHMLVRKSYVIDPATCGVKVTIYDMEGI